MDVFISWSGPRSKAAAKALVEWLPDVLHAVKRPFMSAELPIGGRWPVEVASKLAVSKVGVLCVTPANLHSDWLLFEAGALSKTLENTYVCPLLIDLTPADIAGPLAQFQAAQLTEEGIQALLTTINKALGKQALSKQRLDTAFEVWWPRLRDAVATLPEDPISSAPSRSQHELLTEILDLLRSGVIARVRESEQAAKSEPVLDALYAAAIRADIAILAYKFVPDPSGAVIVNVATSKGPCVIEIPDGNAERSSIQALILRQLLGTSVAEHSEGSDGQHRHADLDYPHDKE